MIAIFSCDLVAYMRAVSLVHSKGEGPFLCLLVYVTREKKIIHRSKLAEGYEEAKTKFNTRFRTG